MPDPPQSEPLAEGQPSAKKQKVTTSEDPDEEEDDWEAIEKPDESSTNGLDQKVGDYSKEEGTTTTTEAHAQKPTSKEQQQAKIDQETNSTLKAWWAQEGGGSVPPQNSLQKDWWRKFSRLYFDFFSRVYDCYEAKWRLSICSVLYSAIQGRLMPLPW